MPDPKKMNILLAAGGTGGHLFPAVALADALVKRGANVMIATDERGARYKDDHPKYRFAIVSSATLKPGIWGKAKTLAALGKGCVQSWKLVRDFNPDVVVGFGGYPAFPPLFIAQLLKIPNVLHEANGVLGKANKLLAAGAHKIALSLPETRGVTDHPSFKEKAVVTGNPVRPNVVAKQNSPYPPLGDTAPVNLFIMGGSQGARIFSDIVPDALAKLPDTFKKRLYVAQQCRAEDVERTGAAYQTSGITCDLKEFFFDAPEQLEKCHLFIGRSGASTVSDVTVIGRPAIFVPMEHADMQQKLNAEVVSSSGGAWVIDQNAFTAEALSTRIETLFSLPDTLPKAAAKAAAVGQAQAADNLADLVLSLAHT